ncbi:hypothetical protein AAZX31_11G218500 [Glycine max]|uniref:Uncharacterized protein n=2 Tax=Glycine subgen. Soja TaxID=1462606 RepID=I1LM95_SOYBN|nr:uncharacterized protein LOC100798498 [Glycine max]XP_028197942.1 uncharacterized protein LOC114382604 [Glycine soja]KAG4975082.1 hypothetical protein JHK87_031903 [Glycine soja]KAG4989651.1 hypothetical protein JHK85_032634 [Glycine max]KAG4995238.1 hypothetical protein JHK86_032065 [Glycine max]KAG5125231.1 hypothetical protein JHK82_031968 [Glycine max]KAG5146656.1 hypothetical protein JHK84_032199 [Glycine max]|eukprot:XP_003538382.1 uncharacterized protein LOC100798498 [Glycine max]
MAETSNGNGVYVDEEEQEVVKLKQKTQRVKETLPEVLNRIASAILFPEPAYSGSLLRRIKLSVADHAPLLPEASKNSARDVLLWTRRGTPFRPLFVISVGTVTFVALTALLVFMLFFLAATINAIVISLLISLAAAGGFLALFFAFVTAIYIGALAIAIFAISVTTFWSIVAILIITGFIGFIYTVWLVTRKSFGFAKHSLDVTGSAISSYTTARHAHHLIHTNSK